MIWFRDETYFYLNGYLNKRCWLHWGTENPYLSVFSPLHLQRVTVWCVISSKLIIDTIFIDGMVTRVKYWELLEHPYHLNMTSCCWFRQNMVDTMQFWCLHVSWNDVWWVFDCIGCIKNFGARDRVTLFSPDLNLNDFSYVTSRIDSIGILLIYWRTWNRPSEVRLMHLITSRAIWHNFR